MTEVGFGAGGPWTERLMLAIDRQGFQRRECPSCHRVFKVRATGMEAQLALKRLLAPVECENLHETDWPALARHCPYCGGAASDDQWFTAEQRAFLDKRGQTLGEELRYEQLAHVLRTLAANPGPTYLPVRPKRIDASPPAEPDDMRVVTLFCCGEELKVADSWQGSVRCFLCGTEHEFGGALVRERLAKLLGED
ncbi:MAG: hypothetical protein QM765_06975 [Myxococcales bacterium]